MYKTRKWEFVQVHNINTVTEHRDGSLSCDCVEYALFGHCSHIQHVEQRYIQREEIYRIYSQIR